MKNTTDELPPLAPPICWAIPPFDVSGDNVKDATGARVLVCDEERSCSMAWSEKEIDADPHFICPECGRLGQRMVEMQKRRGAYELCSDGWYRLSVPNPEVSCGGEEKP